MILLGAYQGLRTHEIAKVHGRDIDLDEMTIHVVGKGGYADDLPLHPIVAEVATGFPVNDWWFPAMGRPGRHILGNSVSSIVSQAFKRSGIDRTAHDLRHWFGTELVRSGADLRTAQTLLRHGNLSTTAIYVQIADTQREKAVLRLPIVTCPS
jgi:integrase